MILDRYLIRNIFSYTASVSLVFLCIVVLSRSIQYLEQAAQGEINTIMVMWLILYRLPGFIELILPFGLFLSIIFVLGKMYEDNEMVIMKQCGITQTYLLKLIMSFAFFVSLLVALFSFWLTPISSVYSEYFKSDKTFYEEFSSLSPGIFHELNNGGVFYAETKKGDLYEKVFSNSLLDKNNETLLFSTNAILDKEANSLSLGPGSSFLKTPNGKGTQLSFEKIIINDIPSKSKDNVADFDVVLNEIMQKESLAWKFSLPLLTLISAFIAVPLSKISPRQGRFIKVLPALIIFITYLTLLILFKVQDEQGELINLVMTLFVHFFFMLLGFFLYKKEALN